MGIQFTLFSDPSEWASVYEFTSSLSTNDCWEAEFNSTDSGVIGLFYSLSGCELEPSEGSYEIATLSFEVSEYAEWGGNIGLHFDEVIMAGSGGESIVAAGDSGNIQIGIVGDVNHDGNVDVIDAVSMINFILMFGDDPTESQMWAGDMNEDGTLNILDVVLLVEMILDN